VDRAPFTFPARYWAWADFKPALVPQAENRMVTVAAMTGPARIFKGSMD
jgi:hypothetical protein